MGKKRGKFEFREEPLVPEDVDHFMINISSNRVSADPAPVKGRKGDKAVTGHKVRNQSRKRGKFEFIEPPYAQAKEEMDSLMGNFRFDLSDVRSTGTKPENADRKPSRRRVRKHSAAKRGQAKK